MSPSVLSRRRPWPFDVYLGGIGLMLVPNPQTGKLYEKKSVTGDGVTPQAFDYGSYDPFTEKPYVFGRLIGGLGESVQRTVTPLHYKIARRADLSIGGRAILGPYFAQDGPGPIPGPGPSRVVRGFLASPIPTSTAWLAFLDHGVWQRTAPGTWTLLKDLGPVRIGSWVLYAPPAAPGPQLYVGTDAGLWNFDGFSTWTQCTLPAGMDAYHVERNQGELWIASTTNIIRRTTGDPLTGAGAWGGPIYVGEPSASITNIVALDDQLFVFKTDGVYSVNTDGSINDLSPEVRALGPRVTNGGAVGRWRDRIWVRFGDGYYAVTGGSTATITAAGPERLVEVPPLGTPMASCGHVPWFGYLAVYDGTAGVSRLLKYGTWIPTDQAGGDTPAWTFAEGWHGPIAEWSGKTVSSIAVQPPIQIGSLANPNPVLWVGFTDGTVQFTPLPIASPDPVADPACVFTTDESYVEWPDHTAFAEADDKHFRTFVAEGSKIDATNQVTVSYRTDPTGSFTPLGTPFTRSGQRVSTPAAGVTGTRLGVREYLVGTRTSTPEVTSVALLEQVRPAMIKTFSATARVTRGVARKDGVVDRRDPLSVRNALADLADGAIPAGDGPVTALLPDETSMAVDVVSYAARQVADAPGLGYEVDLVAVSFVANTTFGNWSRVAGHTWQDVAAYTWGQVPTL